MEKPALLCNHLWYWRKNYLKWQAIQLAAFLQSCSTKRLYNYRLVVKGMQVPPCLLKIYLIEYFKTVFLCIYKCECKLAFLKFSHVYSLDTRARAHVCTHTYAHTHTHIYARTHTLAHMHAHARTHTHTCTHARTIQIKIMSENYKI